MFVFITCIEDQCVLKSTLLLLSDISGRCRGAMRRDVATTAVRCITTTYMARCWLCREHLFATVSDAVSYAGSLVAEKGLTKQGEPAIEAV